MEQRAARVRRWVVLVLLAASTDGCLRRYALRGTADALSGAGASYAEDDDPALIRDAAPFGLKLMEQLSQALPDHRGLYLSLASGFTQYGYAFVQQDADRLTDKDLQQARTALARARKLYLRARGYALHGLDLAHPGLRQALLTGNPDRLGPALQSTTRGDVPLLYWAGASWALAISTAKDDPHLFGDMPAVEALLLRALALEESYDLGAIHELYVSLCASRGDFAGATRHFERALSLSGGRRLSVLVTYAEAVLLPQQKKDEFVRLLRRVLDTDISSDDPGWRRERLANIIAQERARWLLSRLGELFAWLVWRAKPA